MTSKESLSAYPLFHQQPSYLLLAHENDEDENTRQNVENVGWYSIVSRPFDAPGNDFCDPCYSHQQKQADYNGVAEKKLMR